MRSRIRGVRVEHAAAINFLGLFLVAGRLGFREQVRPDGRRALGIEAGGAGELESEPVCFQFLLARECKGASESGGIAQ